LNKLTPEKFEKLSQALLNVGIENKTVLKGIIILIFEKATDEPKYCTLYSKLCKHLNENGPNFDDLGCTATTFVRLLLSKCQDEFEARASASSKYEKRSGDLSPEEQEERLVAKQKMLGNIKFIGELGKMGLVQEAIIHRCIQQLLAKKKSVPLSDMSEDIECLCQIMTTVGRRIDTDKAQNIMSQYFARILALSHSVELPSRIRFMLDDLLELRGNKWNPRLIKKDSGPRSISEIRWDHISQVNPMYASAGPPGSMPGMPNIPMPTMGPDGKPYVWFGTGDPWDGDAQDAYAQEKPLIVDDNKDIFGKERTSKPTSQQPATTITMTTTTHQPHFMKEKQQPPQAGGGGGGGAGGVPKKDLFEPHYMRTKKPAPQPSTSATNISLATVMKNEAAANKISSSKKFGLFEDEVDIPNNTAKPAAPTRTSAWNVDPFMPDFSKPTIISPFSDHPPISSEPMQKSNNSYKNSPPSHYSPSSNRQRMQTLVKPQPVKMKSLNGDVSLRPASLIPAANTRLEEKKKVEELPGKLGQFTNLTIQEKSKPKKSGPSKKEIDRKIAEVFAEYESSGSLERAMQELQSLITSTKLAKMVAKQLAQFSSTIARESWQHMADMYKACDNRSVIKADTLAQAVLQLLDDPKVMDIDANKNCLAFFVAYFLSQELLRLDDFVAQFQDGRHYPIVLLSLVELDKRMGRKWLQSEVQKCGADLKTTFPKDQQSDSQVLHISKQQGLAFLFPHLCLQDQLLATMEEKGQDVDIIQWVQDNVGAEIEKRRLVHILVTCVVTMATRTTLADDKHLIYKPEKEVTDIEKEQISSMKSVLKHGMACVINWQNKAIYALQVFCNDMSFPKEMLLRLFIIFYSEEIVEEDVFMRWREDLNETYPGKGKALFQVNSWLQWMEQADEEEEAEEEG